MLLPWRVSKYLVWRNRVIPTETTNGSALNEKTKNTIPRDQSQTEADDLISNIRHVEKSPA